MKIETLEARQLMSTTVTGPTSLQIGNVLYSSDVSGGNWELFRSNPDGSNKTLLKSLPGSVQPDQFFNFNGKLLFDAATGNTANAVRYLWISDGTSGGTVVVFRSPDNFDVAGEPKDFTLLNGLLIFQAENSTELQLLSTDGTAAGTVTLFADFSGINDPGVQGNVFKFIGATTLSATSFAMYQTDGTVAGTQEVNGALLSGGNLQIFGDTNGNTITVDSSGDTTTVSIDGAVQTFDTGDISKIQVFANDGDDSVTLNADVKIGASIDGGAGDDSITGGSGNDTLDGGTGNSFIAGGAGNDTITGNGLDTLIGNDGNDQIENSTAQVGGVFLDGGADDDKLFSNAEHATLRGGGGDDYIDSTSDSSGSDLLDGGPGDDRFVIPGYTATLIGGDGSDSVSLGTIITDITLSTITAHSDAGTFVVSYSSIEKLTTGSFGNNFIKLPAGGSITTVIGGYGNDTIIGTSADEFLDGEDGIDSIVGGGGRDTLEGIGGNDPSVPTVTSQPNSPLLVNGGILRFVGTSGNDQIIFSRSPSDPSKLKVDFNGELSVYHLSDISRFLIFTGTGDVVIKFNEKPGMITIPSKIYCEGNGNDNITTGSGNDRIYGGGGNDTIEGGAGNDVIYGGGGDDHLFGGAGKDYINAGAGTNVLRGEDGVDTIFANKGDDFRGNKGDALDMIESG